MVQFEKSYSPYDLTIGCCSKFLFNYSLIRQISARYSTRNSRNCDETLSLFQLKLMSSMISWEKSARFSLRYFLRWTRHLRLAMCKIRNSISRNETFDGITKSVVWYREKGRAGLIAIRMNFCLVMYDIRWKQIKEPYE